jgi:hypothetical protein
VDDAVKGQAVVITRLDQSEEIVAVQRRGVRESDHDGATGCNYRYIFMEVFFPQAIGQLGIAGHQEQ